jgi:UDP-glucose 4-epimerase
MKILVTGGCGYIGSHTIVDLIENGFEVVSIDSNICSSPKVLEGIEKITGKKIVNYQIDLKQLNETKKVFEEHQDIAGVIHFAALKSVSESMEKPLLYHSNNLFSLINILECVKLYDIPYFVFSSSCSVYGNVEMLPVTEETPFGEAESPYARTKQLSELIINDFSRRYTFVKNILLRYFNPAGTHVSNIIGENSFSPPVALMPVIVDTASGKRDKMYVYGTDYDTRDGSCIRDYIHIMDLANAHTKAIQYLINSKNPENYEIINLGAGNGVTVLEMINAFEKVTGQKLNYELSGRRNGDIVAIYSDYTKAKDKLGWIPKHGIEDIMHTSWNWAINSAKE